MPLLVMFVMRPDFHQCSRLANVLEAHRCSTRVVASLSQYAVTTKETRPAAIVVEVPGPDPDEQLASVAQLHAGGMHPPVFVLACRGSERLSTAAFRAGATDYFSAPFDLPAIADLVASHAARHAGRAAACAGAGRGDRVLIGDSDAMQSARGLLARVAARDVNVLITGETGTGKELAARSIHDQSTRRAKPFVPINCAAIPESLLESELFGYERGAFTGASVRKVGHLQSADGGTAFLDEVGDLGLQAQAKVLRAIESREISPLGGIRPVGVDIRLVAATNHDLERAVQEGRFRSDLYFRLNVARVHLPPLRTRRSDIHLLLAHYIREQNRRFGSRVAGLSSETEAALASYDWPGNVRELRNLVEAACLERDAGEIALADLPELLRARLCEAAGACGSDREQLLSALLATRWNVTRAAERLQWSRMTIYRKMAKYHLVKSESSSSVTS